MSELLGALVAQKRAIEAEIQREKDDRANTLRWLGERLDDVSGKIALLSASVDVDKVALALKVMDVGDYARRGEDGCQAVREAIAQIAQHGGSLWREYIGVKDYAHWRGQRSDHSYGMGPRHGSTVFSIGLTPKTLARRSPEVSPALTDEEMDACIYYLLNIERIQQAAKGQQARSSVT